MRYKNIKLKNTNFGLKFFQKSSLFLYKPCFLKFHFITAKIYILPIYLLNIKSFTFKNKNILYLKIFLCCLCLLLNFIFLMSSESINFYPCTVKYEILYFQF